MILIRDRRPLMSLTIGLVMMISILHLFLQEQQTGFYEPITFRITVNNSQMNSTMSSTLLSTLNESIQFDSKLDYRKLINLNNFEFAMNHNNTCSRNKSHQPLVVILVHSAPENFSKRRTIRGTWGRRDERSLLIFLLGAVTDTTLNDRIVKENAIHDDIVQGNFVDSYRNMTYKHVMGLKWFTYNCKKAHFVLKTDDDVLVNSPLLYESLQIFFSHSSDESSPPTSTITANNNNSSLKLVANKLILCDKIVHSKVKRTYRSKWRVSYDEYSEKFFKPYCPGFGILYTADVVRELYKKAQKSRYFWIDDVHITGTLASELKIPITTGENLFLSPQQTQDILSTYIDDAKKNEFHFLFAKPNLDEREIKQLWDVVLRLQANLE